MDILEVLYKIGYTNLHDYGKEWRTNPLYRDSSNATVLSINKLTGDWYDFASKTGGGIEKLVKLTIGFTTSEEVVQFLGSTTISIAPKNRYELDTIVKFDKELLLKLQPDHTYWLNREISLPTIQTFQGGITYNGRMAHRYVFPIFDDKDNIIGFSGRSLTDNPNYPKWKHIGSKSNWCYPYKWNQEEIFRTKQAVLLESIGDMLTLWDNNVKNTIVTFGIDISSKVIQLLLKADVEDIILGFNNDADKNFVGNKAATDAEDTLVKFFDPHQIKIGLPESKDFGVMSPEQIYLWKQQYLNKN